MKEWFRKNETTITRWMYGIGIVSFILSIVFTIALGRHCEALAWSCALIWFNQSRQWHKLAMEQDEILDALLDELFKKEGEDNGSK